MAIIYELIVEYVSVNTLLFYQMLSIMYYDYVIMVILKNIFLSHYNILGY